MHRNNSYFLFAYYLFKVSAMKCGFLPVSQESVIIGNVSYHDFQGVLIDPSEREMIIKNLGSNSVIIIIIILVLRLKD
jgi:hypothetical protein